MHFALDMYVLAALAGILGSLDAPPGELIGVAIGDKRPSYSTQRNRVAG